MSDIAANKPWLKTIKIYKTPINDRRPMHTRPDNKSLDWTVEKIEVVSSGRQIDIYVVTKAYCVNLEDAAYIATKWAMEYNEPDDTS